MKTITKSNLKAAALAAIATGIATAGSVAASDDFGTFYDKIDGWSQSGLAVGLSLASLIIGGGIGVARSSPLPALGGIALACFFAFGPGVIKSLILGGAVLA